jgi:hypothetical protein
MKHPDMQKILIIGFLLENRLQWQSEVEKEFYKRLFRHGVIYVQIKHEYIIPYMYLTNGGNI